MVTDGLKDDKDKIMLDLITPDCIFGIGKVLTFGAKKYKPNSWQNVKNGHDRHYAAAMRNLMSWRKGEKNDKETGLSHLYHAMANLMFCAHHDKHEKVNLGDNYDI